jgi:excinuclease ABC subunit C
MELISKIKRFPRSPGVYLMKNKLGKVVYVGKAKDLRNRVQSYFREAGDNRLQVRFLRNNIADIDFIATDTEKEALILENNLIKQYQPRYNVKFKDDKTYVSLRLNLRDPYPRLSIVRLPKGPKKDGCLYFGPYSSVKSVKETLRTIYRTFPIRSCTDTVFSQRDRPCLYYQIGQCLGVCINKQVKKEEYQQLIHQVILFLQGRNEELVRILKKAMEREAKALNFEEAARIYKRIQAIEKTVERQKMVSNQQREVDIFGFYREGKTLAIQRFQIRNGKLVDAKADSFVQPLTPDPEILSSFLNQCYTHSYIPEEIYLPFPIEISDILAEVLSERRGSKVQILCPQRGEKRQLVLLANKNAEMVFNKEHGRLDKIESLDKVLEELQKKLCLRNLPRKIECFDISNIGGDQAVGSAVRYDQGVPDKRWYRHYRIKTVQQADDYHMMAEVLERHYRRMLAANELPDLIIVDGGKGQLNIARDILVKLGIHTPDLISLAKDRLDQPRSRVSKRGNKQEKVYLLSRKNPVILPSRSSVLFLLQRIRDEAHRFALSYHRKLRHQKGLASPLDNIPGIGPKRKQLLLQHFGSLNQIAQATIEQLSQVPTLNKRLAQDIFAFFHQHHPLKPSGGQDGNDKFSQVITGSR